jgi:hypothetical protein
MFLISLFLLTSNAFADKILSPGEFYTSAFAGERIVCTGASSQPETQYFLADGTTLMSPDEMRDGTACSGQTDSSTGAELRAKNIAESNGRGVQCPQGFTCEVQQGAMQYQRRGSYCTAYMPFVATRR